jgi:hypothetical protein
MRSTAVLAALVFTFAFAARELRAEDHAAGSDEPAAHSEAPAQPHSEAAPIDHTTEAPAHEEAAAGRAHRDAPVAHGSADSAPPGDSAPAAAHVDLSEPAAADSEHPADSAVEASSTSELEAHTAEPPTESPTASHGKGSTRRHSIELGPKGYDEGGHEGRVHFVARGDTLWDIARAYLATPWVWPSIWRDNRNIANPHRIYPGDRIWITDGEMRVVSAEEAQQMIEREPPAAPAAEPALAAAPAAEPAAEPESTPRLITLNNNHLSGFVTPQQLEAAASVVEGFTSKQMHSVSDEVYVGLGEGQAQPAEILQAYRGDEKILDPETRRVLGYHVELLGRIEVTQVHPETSTGIVRQSTSEIELGDRVMPYEPIPHEVEVRRAPADLQGRIAFIAKSRTQMAQEDYVFLNRGSDHGLALGAAVEAYRPGRSVRETVRGENVMLPERPIAQLIVVRVGPNAATAVVLHSETELEIGDPVRASTYAPLAAR